MIHNHEVGGSIPPLATTSVLVKQWGKGRLSGLSFPCFLEGVLRGTLSIATRHAATNAREPAIGYSRVGGQLSPRPYQGRGSQSCRLVGMGFSAEKPGGFFITTRHAASFKLAFPRFQEIFNHALPVLVVVRFLWAGLRGVFCPWRAHAGGRAFGRGLVRATLATPWAGICAGRA